MSSAEYIERWNAYFHCIGSKEFATHMAQFAVVDTEYFSRMGLKLSDEGLLAATRHHGDIGQEPSYLTALSGREQSKVLAPEAAALRAELRKLGELYKAKYDIKFMIFASGRSPEDLLEILKNRLENGDRATEWQNARAAVTAIGLKRLTEHSMLSRLDIRRHHAAVMNDVALSISNGSSTLAQDINCKSIEVEFIPFVVAVGLEVLQRRSISIHSLANDLLASTSSTSLRLSGEYAHQVTLLHLIRHNSGVRPDRSCPVLPGSRFEFNAGAVTFFKRTIEAVEGLPFATIASPFIAKLGLDPADIEFGEDLVCSAAGPHCLQRFAARLSAAYNDMDGSVPFSQETARLMLFDMDARSVAVLAQRGCKVGAGVFILEALENKFLLFHSTQKTVSTFTLQCFHGRDCGRGFTVSVYSDTEFATEVMVKMAQSLVRAMQIQSIASTKFLGASIAASDFSPEEYAAKMLKEGLLINFEPSRAEDILDKGPRSMWASENAFTDARLIIVSNDRFARADNLASAYEPVFDPVLFGRQGKIMDSWESVRHNTSPYDEAVFQLQKASKIRYVFLSTKYHTGNAVMGIRLFGASPATTDDRVVIASLFEENPDVTWVPFLGDVSMEGHSYRRIDLGKAQESFSHIRIQVFPDGGFTRLGLFEENSLKPDDAATFVSLEFSVPVKFRDTVPATQKPMTLAYTPTAEEIAINRRRVCQRSKLVDVASLALGAVVLQASDEHYGPASQALSPFPPLNMFDGLESARSRNPSTSFETLEIKLAWSCMIRKIEIDFTYFVNNSPRDLTVEFATTLEDDRWQVLVPRRWVKHYFGGWLRIPVTLESRVAKLRFKLFPCGGLNRVHVIADSEQEIVV